MNTSSCSFLTWLQNGRTRPSVPNPCWASVTTEPAPEKRRSPQGLVAHFYKEPKTLLAFAKLFLHSVPPTGVLQGGEAETHLNRARVYVRLPQYLSTTELWHLLEKMCDTVKLFQFKTEMKQQTLLLLKMRRAISCRWQWVSFQIIGSDPW